MVEQSILGTNVNNIFTGTLTNQYSLPPNCVCITFSNLSIMIDLRVIMSPVAIYFSVVMR
jgi:hypothetical protein